MSVDGGRVAHVMRNFGEPSQTFVPDAISELERLGWEGWVVTPRIRNREWFPSPPDDRMLLARRPPATVRALNRVRRHSPQQRDAAWYGPAIRAARPSLIHAHFGWAAIPAAPSAQRLGVPLVVTFHATDVTVFPHEDPANAAAYRRVFPHVAAALVVSRFTESHLRAAGYDGRVDIVPAGVRLDRLPYRGALLPTDEIRLLFVGRLVPRKGLDVLLRALAPVAAAHPGLTLDVVGDGPLREASVELASHLGVADRVRFHGAVAGSEVRRRLERAHVFVLPSRTTPDGEAEGSPVATKEALAIGVPVVATDNGGTVETLPPAYRHEIVAEEDPPALAERILRLLDSRERWPDRAAEGRAWVESEFDGARLAAQTAEIYSQVLEDSPVSTGDSKNRPLC